ncbi:ArsR/SmtB family transcription factor [Ideonella sp.]|uniref:ArsR/SmtB family transcription factor n=1 Tax=Ideonella sp. TaxID=1929293 RepID=UPI0035B423FD
MPPAADPLSSAFAALADPTRRAILARLAQGHTHVGDLAQPFAISAPAVSRHLRVLEQAGLIERQVDARWRICHLRPEGLQGAHDWLAQYRRYWEASLDRLAELLEAPHPAPEPAQAPTRPRRPSTRAPRTHAPLKRKPR